MEKHVDDQFELAKQAYEYIESQPKFDCAAQPQSNILCFRLSGGDQLQLDIRDQLITRGEFYLSTTVFAGQRYLRMVFNHPETGLDDIKQLIQTIRELMDV